MITWKNINTDVEFNMVLFCGKIFKIPKMYNYIVIDSWGNIYATELNPNFHIISAGLNSNGDISDKFTSTPYKNIYLGTISSDNVDGRRTFKISELPLTN